jgi:hypothetical protein
MPEPGQEGSRSMNADTHLDDYAMEAIQEFYDSYAGEETKPAMYRAAESWIHDEINRILPMLRARLQEEADRLIAEVTS